MMLVHVLMRILGAGNEGRDAPRRVNRPKGYLRPAYRDDAARNCRRSSALSCSTIRLSFAR